jgi:cullin-associated NEDD8-dissociated protein 1
LTTRLLGGISQDAVQEIKLECLDIITDLLKRFGHAIEPEHENLMSTVLQQLQHNRAVVRKRATASLGSLAICLSDSLLKRLTETLLGRIESPGEGAEVRTLIQTIGSISRTVGYRMGKDLDQIVPLFLKCIGDPEDEEQQNEEANELRENCLQGFQSFVLRCSREVTPHLNDIIGVCQAFLKYDPNYTYGSDEEEDAMEEDDMEFSDEDFGDFSDDDDTSWKVRLVKCDETIEGLTKGQTYLLTTPRTSARLHHYPTTPSPSSHPLLIPPSPFSSPSSSQVRRASLHVLTSIISTRPEMLKDMYASSGT